MRELFGKIPLMMDSLLQKALDTTSVRPERQATLEARERLIKRLKRLNGEMIKYSQTEGEGFTEEQQQLYFQFKNNPQSLMKKSPQLEENINKKETSSRNIPQQLSFDFLDNGE